jgi:actin-related protein
MKKIFIIVLSSAFLFSCSTQEDSQKHNYFKEGKEELNAGNYDEAVGLFTIALKEDPDNESIQSYLDEAKEKQAKEEKREQELKQEEEKRKKEKEERDKKEKEEAAKREKFRNVYAAAYFTEVLTDNALLLSETTENFMISNYELFPAMSKDSIEKTKNKADDSITGAHINKNPVPYHNKLVTFEGEVISIEETQDSGYTIAYIHVMDNDWQSHEVILLKTTGDILEGDWVRFWGIVVGKNSFPNVSGGTTNTIFHIGSHIEKR